MLRVCSNSPAVTVTGCAVKANLAGDAGVTLNAALVAPTSGAEEATSVYPEPALGRPTILGTFSGFWTPVMYRTTEASCFHSSRRSILLKFYRAKLPSAVVQRLLATPPPSPPNHPESPVSAPTPTPDPQRSLPRECWDQADHRRLPSSCLGARRCRGLPCRG